MEAEKFFHLASVGSMFELKTGNIFPQKTNGKPDLDNPTHLSEISEDWLNSLKGIDEAFVGIWFKNNNPHWS